MIATFGKICVAIYAFISGYGLCRSYAKKQRDGSLAARFGGLYPSIAFRMLRFLRKYWLVFALFVPIGYFIGANRDYGWNEFFQGIFAWEFAYNPHWWYVKQYLYMLLLFPFLELFFDFFSVPACRNVKRLFLIGGMGILYAGLLYLTFGVSLNAVVYCLAFLIGYICARYALFDRVVHLLHAAPLRIITGLLLLAACVAARWGYRWCTYDFLFAPLFCLAFCLLTAKEGRVTALLARLGKYSVYMWMTHGFYCWYYFRPFIMASHISTVMYLQLFAVSLLTAIALVWLEKFLVLGWERLRALCAARRAQKTEPPPAGG